MNSPKAHQSQHGAVYAESAVLAAVMVPLMVVAYYLLISLWSLYVLSERSIHLSRLISTEVGTEVDRMLPTVIDCGLVRETAENYIRESQFGDVSDMFQIQSVQKATVNVPYPTVLLVGSRSTGLLGTFNRSRLIVLETFKELSGDC